MGRWMVVAMLAMAPGVAWAQGSCVPLTPPNQCTGRFPNPADRITAGNIVYCDGVPASTVQADFFRTAGGVRIYDCSVVVACTYPSLPANVKAKFCP